MIFLNSGVRDESCRVPWTSKKINPEYSLKGLMLKLKLQYSGHLMQRTDSFETDSFEKTLILEKIEGRRRRWLDGHEFEQAPGVDDGQGSLACFSPWGRKDSDTTE